MKVKLIYALLCPFTKEVHYIGKSSNGMIRPSQHLKKSHSEKINEWVEELKSLGQKPDIKVVCYVSVEEDLDEVERLTISRHVKKGCNLLNSTLVKPETILPTLGEEDRSGMKAIGNFVKTKRKSVGLNQSDFANRCGVGLRFLRELEQNSKDNFNTENVNQVLCMFGHKLSLEKI